MTQHKTDIAIIGAGMAGLTLAALLGQQGFRVTVIDREHPENLAKESFDSRTVALSAGTRGVLEPLGIWEQMRPSAATITEIDVQEGHDPFLLNFQAGQVGAEAFGWIFPNTEVRRVLYETALAHGVTFMAPTLLRDIRINGDVADVVLQNGQTLQASLVVGADGRFSRVRELTGVDGVQLSYHQTALVGLVEHERPHQGLAVERFYNQGPFAILPFTDLSDGTHRSAVVWTTDDQKGRKKPLPSHDEITLALQPLFDERYGAIRAIGPWAQYPLSLYHAKEFVADRVALVSDAAHAIHPIAGQGLNLGMRDVAVLARLLGEAKAANTDLGGQELLRLYQQERRFDVFAMVAATDLLNRLFGNKLRSMRWLRSAGLGLVNRLPPLKNFFVRVAMGEKQ